MSSSHELLDAYEAYLRSGLPADCTEKLASVLEALGYALESSALKHHLSGRTEPFVCQARPWQGTSCIVAQSMPAIDASKLWFDLVDLSCSFLENEPPGYSEHGRGWISVRPVHAWQYLAYLRIAQPRSGIGGDRYDPARFADRDLLQTANDIYPDEAWDYCAWFGKRTLCFAHWEFALPSLTRSKKASLSPNGMLLWDSHIYTSGSHEAYAFDADTGEVVTEEFSDSDRSADVGFATFAASERGLLNFDINSSDRGWHETAFHAPPRLGLY